MKLSFSSSTNDGVFNPLHQLLLRVCIRRSQVDLLLTIALVIKQQRPSPVMLLHIANYLKCVFVLANRTRSSNSRVDDGGSVTEAHHTAAAGTAP